MPRYSIIVVVEHTYEVEADDMDTAKDGAEQFFELEMAYVPYRDGSSYEVQEKYGDEMGNMEPDWDEDDR